MNQTEELVNELVIVLKSTKSFVSEQAPDVLKQIVTKETVTDILGVIMCFAICIILNLVAKTAMEKMEKVEIFDREGYYGTIAFSIVVFFISLGYLLKFIHDLAVVYVAPKVFLLEYLIRLVKK